MSNGPERIIVPKDRILERTQGCWNCKHWSVEAAIKKWSTDRQRDLSTALEIAMSSPLGEDHVQVKNIRVMVDKLDREIAAGSAGVCHGGGKTPTGEPVGDYVTHNYLCGQWSGASGASVARGGQKTDKLPEEIAEILDGPRPTLKKKGVE